MEPTILLVEDDPDDEALILRELRRSNVANPVFVVRDGAEALELLHATGGDAGKDTVLPQLVLLDLELPKIDGLEVLRRLRADPRTSTVPVVILTSSDDEHDRIQGLALGAHHYVRKPLGFIALAAAVRHLGLYWHVLNPPRRQHADFDYSSSSSSESRSAASTST